MTTSPSTYELAVFKLDLATQDLVQIKDLRGHALFVSFGTSFFVSVNDFPALTLNCVYLAHDNTKCRRFRHIAKEVRVYNLQDDTFADQSTQTSWKNCPHPALWVQPTWSLNKMNNKGSNQLTRPHFHQRFGPALELSRTPRPPCFHIDMSSSYPWSLRCKRANEHRPSHAYKRRPTPLLHPTHITPLHPAIPPSLPFCAAPPPSLGCRSASHARADAAPKQGGRMEARGAQARRRRPSGTTTNRRRRRLDELHARAGAVPALLQPPQSEPRRSSGSLLRRMVHRISVAAR